MKYESDGQQTWKLTQTIFLWPFIRFLHQAMLVFFFEGLSNSLQSLSILPSFFLKKSLGVVTT